MSRQLIQSKGLCESYRTHAKAFTRSRCLTFPVLLLLMLRNSVKSLQLLLNELAWEQQTRPVTASAFTQARAQVSHQVFIELNRRAVVDVMYGDDNINRYHGFRLLAIDGSKILLPHHPSVQEHFGEIGYSNDHPDVKGTHAYGLASVLYDVLNHVAIDSVLGQAKDYEVALATQHHVPHLQSDDLVICDRNYPSYQFLATLSAAKTHFVMRCSAQSFKTARHMLNGEGADTQVVKLKPHHSKQALMKTLGLPMRIKVRFVRVLLETGEFEVLVTNVFDLPTCEFRMLYHLRWEIEGFYGLLKGRLALENFTGQTAQSVLQDFYAAIYLSGLETLLTADVNAQLAEKSTKYPQQVNHAVSFHTIKLHALDLLWSDLDEDVVIARLEELFFYNPTILRMERVVPRKKTNTRRSLHHAKRQRKVCY